MVKLKNGFTGERALVLPRMIVDKLEEDPLTSMLHITDMKINQICYKIGIEDTYYFSRLFSKIMGMSPREYRKSKKG